MDAIKLQRRKNSVALFPEALTVSQTIEAKLKTSCWSNKQN